MQTPLRAAGAPPADWLAGCERVTRVGAALVWPVCIGRVCFWRLLFLLLLPLLLPLLLLLLLLARRSLAMKAAASAEAAAAAAGLKLEPIRTGWPVGLNARCPADDGRRLATRELAGRLAKRRTASGKRQTARRPFASSSSKSICISLSLSLARLGSTLDSQSSREESKVVVPPLSDGHTLTHSQYPLATQLARTMPPFRLVERNERAREYQCCPTGACSSRDPAGRLAEQASGQL